MTGTVPAQNQAVRIAAGRTINKAAVLSFTHGLNLEYQHLVLTCRLRRNKYISASKFRRFNFLVFLNNHTFGCLRVVFFTLLYLYFATEKKRRKVGGKCYEARSLGRSSLFLIF